MALPSAQLGGMPNMNFPGYVPVVQKRPNMWEQALATFLANAAGGLAERGTANLMAPEHASGSGEAQPRKFGLQKFLYGPAVSDQEAADIRRETENKRQFNLALEERKRETTAAEDRAARELMDKRNAEVREWTRRTRADTAAHDLGAMQTSADTARNIATEGRQSRVADANIAAANAERILREAQAKNLISEAEYRDFMGKLMRGEITQDPVTKKFVPTGSVQPAAPPPQQSAGFGYPGAVGRWLGEQWMGTPSEWAREPPPTNTSNIDPRLAAIMDEKYRKEHPAYQPYYMGIH